MTFFIVTAVKTLNLTYSVLFSFEVTGRRIAVEWKIKMEMKIIGGGR
jgi:hypothetical protein